MMVFVYFCKLKIFFSDILEKYFFLDIFLFVKKQVIVLHF